MRRFLPIMLRSPSNQTAIAIVAGLIFLSLLPFAAALGIHHALAEVDHDGHQHSEFDLCQWVEKHSSGSLPLDVPMVGGLPFEAPDQVVLQLTLFTSRFHSSSNSPRAPPLS